METSRLMDSGSTRANRYSDTESSTDLSRYLDRMTAKIELERAKQDLSGCQSDFSVRHPWLRNLIYFGPPACAFAAGVARAVIAPEEPLTYVATFVAGTIWTIGSCVHLRTDRKFADMYYGGDFRYC